MTSYSPDLNPIKEAFAKRPHQGKMARYTLHYTIGLADLE
jgi:hypothetical protein